MTRRSIHFAGFIRTKPSQRAAFPSASSHDLLQKPGPVPCSGLPLQHTSVFSGDGKGKNLAWQRPIY